MNSPVIYDNYYQIYLDKVKELAQTITIKSEETAAYMNKHIKNTYGADAVSNKIQEWVYYKNICGEYHFSNKKMTVISMDTLEEIEFNKLNLSKHTATRTEYQFGTRRYEELVARYPDQEMLILGILYPADINKAITSDNYTILSYPEQLVESNEYSLIPRLQEWLYGFKLRWVNYSYECSDPYVAIVFMGLMYTSLVPVILNIRKSLCKTNEAHSYHVQRYLASHGFLDDYLDVMTTKQSLKFYKNINWLERNIGSTEAQKWLYENALTERAIPIAEYSAKHSTKNLLENLYPGVFFEKKSINNLEVVTEFDNLSLTEMLRKEEKTAPGNQLFTSENKDKISNLIKYSLSNKVKTKVLESNMNDYSNAKEIKLEDVILNLWLDLADRNIFVSVIPFVDPLTGENIPLTAKDAFILYFYAYWKWQADFKFKEIPSFYASRVPRDVLYSKVLPKDGLPSDFKYEIFLQKIAELMIKPEKMISLSAFYNYCHDLYLNANSQLYMVAQEEHYIVRSYKELAVARFYCDRNVKLIHENDKTTYDEWLVSKEIDYKKYSRKDWGLLANSILNNVTCKNSSDVKSLKAIQSAMIRLTKQLSSYSVQFIQEMHDAGEQLGGLLLIREGDNKEHGKEIEEVDISFIKILNISEKGKQYLGNIPVFDNHEMNITSSGKEHLVIDDPIEISNNPLTSKAFLTVTSGVDAYMALPDVSDINPRNLIVFPGIDSYLKLPISEQIKIKDAWGRDYWYPSVCDKESNVKESLSWNLLNPNLNGFDYTLTRPLYLKELNGFSYNNANILNLPGKIIGFNYLNKPDFDIVETIDGFSYYDRQYYSISELFANNILMGFDIVDNEMNIVDLFEINQLNGFYSKELLDLSELKTSLGLVGETPEKLISIIEPTISNNDLTGIGIEQ